jgi:hypothetical protein
VDAFKWLLIIIGSIIGLFIGWLIIGYIILFTLSFIPSILILGIGIYFGIVVGGPVGAILIILTVIGAIGFWFKWNESPAFDSVMRVLGKIFPYDW